MATVRINGKTIEIDGPVANVSVQGDSVIVNGRSLGDASGDIIIEGDVGELRTDRNAQVTGNVSGNVKAGGSIRCGDVGGDCKASGSIDCGDVSRSVKAGGSVNAGRIEGSVKAGGSVNL